MEELLELFVGDKSLVSVQDCDVEVGVGVTQVGPGLQQRLDLVLRRTTIQKPYLFRTKKHG